MPLISERARHFQEVQRAFVHLISSILVHCSNDALFPVDALSPLSSIFTPNTPLTPSTPLTPNSPLLPGTPLTADLFGIGSDLLDLPSEFEWNAVDQVMEMMGRVSNCYQHVRASILDEDYSSYGPQFSSPQPMMPEIPIFESPPPIFDPLDPIPSYCGNFDLYSMNIPLLNRTYLPHGSSGAPQHQAVYDEIMNLQARSDFTSRCHLPPVERYNRSTSGILQVPPLGESTDQESLQVSLAGIVLEDILLTDAELTHFPDPLEVRSRGPGVWASIGLSEQQYGIDSIFGFFRMKRVWMDYVDVFDEEEEGAKANHEYTGMKELFEGCFTFEVKYSQWMNRKERTYSLAFWAVKARMDDFGMDEDS